MKRFILTSVLIVTFSVPAFASDQLAKSVGVEPGMYTTAELMWLIKAGEESDFALEQHILGGGAEVVSTQSYGADDGRPGINEVAKQIFEQLAAE